MTRIRIPGPGGPIRPRGPISEPKPPTPMVDVDRSAPKPHGPVAGSTESARQGPLPPPRIDLATGRVLPDRPEPRTRRPRPRIDLATMRPLPPRPEPVTRRPRPRIDLATMRPLPPRPELVTRRPRPRIDLATMRPLLPQLEPASDAIAVPAPAPPIPEPQTSSTTLPYRREMEQAFGTSFAGVAAHLGEEEALARFGARAAAWSETVAFASQAPTRDVVAHELAHIEQLRRASGNAPSGAASADHPAEREAAQIAAAVQAGAPRVQVTAAPGGVVAYDRGPAGAAETFTVVRLIEELRGHVAALESVVLTDEGRAQTARVVEDLLAQLDASSHAALSPEQQALVDHAGELVAQAQLTTQEPRTFSTTAPGARLGHVCAPRGLRLRREPRPDAPDLGIIPFDTRVEIHHSAHDWVYVTVVAQGVGAGTAELVGTSGFVEGRFVLLDSPDIDSFLYLVQPGDTAARVAARFFAPPEGFSVGHDAYLFVNALWATNQGLHTAAGSYPGAMRERPVELTVAEELVRSESRETALRDYLGARLVAGNALWIPSVAKVRALMRSGKIASATPLSELGEQGGFLRGLFDGIVDGVRDQIKQAKELAYFLYDLCEKGLIDVLTDLVKKVTQIIRGLDTKQLVAAGKAALLDFINQWTQEDEFLRGHFQGKAIGYLVVLIVPMLLTEGLGELAASPRALRGVQQLAAAVPRGELVAELSAGLRRAKLVDRLLESGFLKREGLVAEKFEGGFEAIEKQFDPVLRAAFPKDEPWEGFMHDRMEDTRFMHEERMINFQMERSMNKFSVAEEVQHALDYTLGAKDPMEVLVMARKLKIPDKEVVNWWHRRVFTRMMKNINANEHGLGYLKPRLAEVHKIYTDIGGKLTLDQILSTTWEGLF